MTSHGYGAGLQAGPALTVSLDGSGRVSAVQIHRLPDALRRPPEIAAELRAALAAGAAERRPAAPLVVDPAGRPVVRRMERPVTPPLRALVAAAVARPSDEPLHRSRPPIGGEQGHSDNGLVTVTLDRAGPGGDLDVEPVWLGRARSAQVAAAITEAFTAAYRERDAR